MTTTAERLALAHRCWEREGTREARMALARARRQAGEELCPRCGVGRPWCSDVIPGDKRLCSGCFVLNRLEGKGPSGLGGFRGKTWRDAIRAYLTCCLDEFVPPGPAKQRRKALLPLRPHSVLSTSWGTKIWQQEVRNALGPARGPALRDHWTAGLGGA